jgi:hypothetical protein
MTCGIGNQDPDLDRHKNVVGFNQFIFKMAVQSFDLWIVKHFSETNYDDWICLIGIKFLRCRLGLFLQSIYLWNHFANLRQTTRIVCFKILWRSFTSIINWTVRMSDNLPERVQISFALLYGKTELSAVKYLTICS